MVRGQRSSRSVCDDDESTRWLSGKVRILEGRVSTVAAKVEAFMQKHSLEVEPQCSCYDDWHTLQVMKTDTSDTVQQFKDHAEGRCEHAFDWRVPEAVEKAKEKVLHIMQALMAKPPKVGYNKEHPCQEAGPGDAGHLDPEGQPSTPRPKGKNIFSFSSPLCAAEAMDTHEKVLPSIPPPPAFDVMQRGEWFDMTYG